MKRIPLTELAEILPPPLLASDIDSTWQKAAQSIPGKIIVLDDDPTGTQTVHSLPVYTGWDNRLITQMLQEPGKVAYILTNSRALSASQTEAFHRNLARSLAAVADACHVPLTLISRSDSTLRGHYPLETACIADEWRQRERPIDAEILCPFFMDGGRLTIGDIHYVREGNELVPAGQTEFAKDSTFGYQSSDLKQWIAEKTAGRYPAEAVASISLSDLRFRNIEHIVDCLTNANDFQKIVVNAVDDQDMKVFVIALAQAMAAGKRFLFRSAASLVQAMGGICRKPLLTGRDVTDSSAPGLIVAGSYVQKTTAQVNALIELPGLAAITFDASSATSDEALAAEASRVASAADQALGSGNDVCIVTSRRYIQAGDVNARDKNLAFSVRVSAGLVETVKRMRNKPGFLIAKGGITSSDIGVNALGVKRAMVEGQIYPGVPVWRLGPESRLPGMAYIIFPGNVGEPDALKQIVAKIRAD